jgi:hypothetical protein
MHSNALSPIDEWVYSDYLDKVPAEVVVKQGELIGPTALNRIACDGIYPYGPMGAPCGTSYSDVSKFPFAGHTSADGYTPLYFVSTWAVGRVIRFIAPVDELTSWRLTSPLWLAGTVLVLFLLLRRQKVRPVVMLAVGTAFIVSPFSWWTYTYVSTDAPSVLFGGLLLLLASHLDRRPARTWWLLAASALAVAFKVTNILAVCLIALFLVLTWVQQIQHSRRERGSGLALDRPSLRLPLIGVAAVGAALVVELAWLEIRKAIAVGPVAGLNINQRLPLMELARQSVNFLPGTLTSNVTVSGGTSTTMALPLFAWAVAPLSWMCIAGVLAGVWSASLRSTRWPVMMTTAVASVMFAPMLAVALAFTQGTYFEMPPRYGAPILAAMLLVCGLTMRNRLVAWVFLIYSVALGIGMLAITATL